MFPQVRMRLKMMRLKSPTALMVLPPMLRKTLMMTQPKLETTLSPTPLRREDLPRESQEDIQQPKVYSRMSRKRRLTVFAYFVTISFTIFERFKTHILLSFAPFPVHPHPYTLPLTFVHTEACTTCIELVFVSRWKIQELVFPRMCCQSK